MTNGQVIELLFLYSDVASSFFENMQLIIVINHCIM